MNPIYDLIVIGIIVSMVLLNTSFSREPRRTVSSWAALTE